MTQLQLTSSIADIFFAWQSTWLLFFGVFLLFCFLIFYWMLVYSTFLYFLSFLSAYNSFCLQRISWRCFWWSQMILMTVAEVASDDDVMKIMWHAFLWGSVLSVQNSCLLYVADRRPTHWSLFKPVNRLTWGEGGENDASHVAAPHVDFSDDSRSAL